VIGPMSHASIVFVDPVDSYDFIFNDYLSVSSPVNIHVSLNVHTCLLVLHRGTSYFDVLWNH